MQKTLDEHTAQLNQVSGDDAVLAK
jgi:hypothetical protein